MRGRRLSATREGVGVTPSPVKLGSLTIAMDRKFRTLGHLRQMSYVRALSGYCYITLVPSHPYGKPACTVRNAALPAEPTFKGQAGEKPNSLFGIEEKEYNFG